MDDLLQLSAWAECKADEPALLAPGQEFITYRVLPGVLHRARGAFKAAGFGEQEAAAVLMQPGFASLLTCLAVSGEAACAPIDPSLTQDEFRKCFVRLRVSTLVVQDTVESPALAAARELGLRVLRAACSGSGDARELTVEPLFLPTQGGAGRRTDAALLLLTSSTTGDPKLVPVTAANLHARVHCDGRALGLGDRDRYLAFMPMFHLHGLSAVLTQLTFGGSVALTRGFDPGQFASWWKEFHPTWFSAGIPVLHAIAALGPADREVFSAHPPRFIRVTGASPEPALREAIETMMHAPVLVGYGLTEAGSTTRNRISAAKPGSVGTSVGLEIAVAGHSGDMLAPNQDGEILLRGPAVVSGYLDDDEANLRTFRNGWFHTGDLGRLDDDGFLFINGRLKEIINRGGEKILPGEVDGVLASHPEVQDVAAFGIPHRTLGEDIAAAVVLRKGAQVTEAELRRYAASRLAAFKIPRLLVFLDSIPRSASGKPKRNLLASRYGAATPRESLVEAHAAEAKVNDVQRRVIRIWKGILDDSPVTVEDDFVRLGGDSLSALRMLVEVDAEFRTGGRVLARPDFFDEPTVGVLSRILAECQADADRCERAAPGILAFRREGEGVPLFFLPGWRGRDGGAADLYYPRHLAKGLGDGQPFYVVAASVPARDGTAGSVEELARRSVEAIRGVRPQGPYALAGHCLGAVVAFEAARQLLAEGDTVPRLLLFDAVAPGYPKMAAHWSKYAAEVFRMIRHLDWKEGWSHAYSFARLLNQRITGKFRRRMIRPDPGKPGNAKVLPNRRAVALWQYIPGVCSVPILHFIAADHPVSKVLDDPRYGWRDFARAGIEFQNVPGDHDSMFSLENAPRLAARVKESLATRALAATAE